MRTVLLAAILLGVIAGLSLFAQESGKRHETPPRPTYSVEDSIRGAKSYKPAAGYIPDEATAVKVAEAVLIPIYGEQNIVSQRPFKASLRGRTWTIVGTLKPGLVGGTAILKLSKDDGRILFVTHTQ